MHLRHLGLGKVRRLADRQRVDICGMMHAKAC
jgi:hypothetical protein